MIRYVLSTLALLTSFGNAAHASDLYVYGPGGPLPPMKEAAAAFGKLRGITVNVEAGPTSQWIGKARQNADVIYSGSEAMMSDFVIAMQGRIHSKDVQPLYLRASSILVRPGNPKHIHGLSSLLKPGMKVLVVHGAGQTGLWEDVAGRGNNINDVRKLRSNIGDFAPNSAAAKQIWVSDPSYDAWLIWDIWQVSNRALADKVQLDAKHRIYRDADVAETTRGKSNPDAAAFVEFLKGPDGARIFRKWGWATQQATSAG